MSLRKRVIIASLAIVLVALCGIPASAHVVWFQRYPGETGGTSYTYHDWQNYPGVILCQARYSLELAVNWGQATTSNMTINYHTVRLYNVTGDVYGGVAYLSNNENWTVSNAGLWLLGRLTPGSTYRVNWNRSVPLGPVNRSVAITQYLHPGQPAADESSYCSNRDDVIFVVGSSPASPAGGNSAHANRDHDESISSGHSHDRVVSNWDEASRLFGQDSPLLRPTYIPDGLKLRSQYVDTIGKRHNILFANGNNGIEVIQYRGKLIWNNTEERDDMQDRFGSNKTVLHTRNIEGRDIWIIQFDTGTHGVSVLSNLSLDETAKFVRNLR